MLWGAAEQVLQGLTKPELLALKALVRPHRHVERVFHCVGLLKGIWGAARGPMPWAASKEMMQSPTFQIELVLLDLSSVPQQAALSARRLLAEIKDGVEEIRRISPGAAVLFEWLQMVLSWKLDGSAPAGPLAATSKDQANRSLQLGGERATPLLAGGMLQLSTPVSAPASFAVATGRGPDPCRARMRSNKTSVTGFGAGYSVYSHGVSSSRPPGGLRRSSSAAAFLIKDYVPGMPAATSQHPRFYAPAPQSSILANGKALYVSGDLVCHTNYPGRKDVEALALPKPPLSVTTLASSGVPTAPRAGAAKGGEEQRMHRMEWLEPGRRKESGRDPGDSRGRRESRDPPDPGGRSEIGGAGGAIPS